VNIEERIRAVEEFKRQLGLYRLTPMPAVRAWLNQHIHEVKRIAIEAKTFSYVVIGAPPILKAPPVTIDPFETMFETVYNRSLIPTLIDMLDKTIGALRNPLPDPPETVTEETNAQQNYAFIAMPMEADDKNLVDVLDTIKTAAKECGITAERIDDDNKNERITNRMLENIRKAEFAIVDLTHERPSVYYEAGYAERSGKTPIFVARKGTPIHFDVKDFPIIFFENYKELREQLTARLRAILNERYKA
jgi:hypothetical protein